MISFRFPYDGNLFIFRQILIIHCMTSFSLARFASLNILLFVVSIVNGQDAAVQSILQPTATVCGGDLFPTIVVGNAGMSDLTSLRVNYELDGTVVANYSWLGTLMPGQTDTISFPFLSLALGVYNLRIYTSDPNFSVDVNPLNDTLIRTFEVTESIGVAPPFKADFDDSGFPYTGYIVNNPDGAVGWTQTEVSAFTGSGSLYMNNYNYSGIGQQDEFTLPGIDISKLDKGGLSFFVSYAQYGLNSGFADTLEILVSGDCGITFDQVYKKYGSDLATAPPTTAEFFPRGSFDWRKEWVDLSTYFESTFLVIQFRHTSNYENNLFLDRIRVEQIFALSNEDELAEGRKLYSFVNSAGSIDVSFEGFSRAEGQLSLTDVHGRVLYTTDVSVGLINQPVSIPAQGLSPGVYFIQVTGDQPVATSVIIK